ncbi:bacteriohemerythrin [Candidatus Magnetomonas plexicatena]|uniref:bacteriohemerythrin n=1 Tax=Candidatus Magnetomonas plexicatena TaxID=2552947 RepID=UPI001C74D8EC|nr:bacteriohemerythrin [Nitrospirales bacterium LBB_01]
MKITKIEVAKGIQWVEIPEANLRVLCGCPADSVKHLIKRGLILPQEVKGVACETGPNAILLSDLSLQNGEFSNLAEFPVLQMLYKQGLILPGHPNNTGHKPILIGSAAQIESQISYIYRGNYGLVSTEEIAQTGVPLEQAHDMMRLKLKFAFGRIRPTRDFIDTCILADDAVEVVNGVTLSRLQTNVFQFAYGGETVTVNLNLLTEEKYECPYPLGFRKLESEYFAVINSGEGDGWDIERPCMSSIITFQGRLYLIDAGPQISHTLAALGIDIDQVDGIFHTHAHDDHFAGLTTLMRAGRRITYFATPLVRASVTKKLCALLAIDERKFTDFFEIRDLAFDTWTDIEGLEVMPVFSPHPIETNIFIFRTLWGNGYRTYCHFADIVSLDILKNMVTQNYNEPGLDIHFFESIRSAYLTRADLKKIDIGGGMIHGDAKDFKTDKSTHILLAHRAGDLTPIEKEIGSSAVFGTCDLLISGTSPSDMHRRNAFTYLQAHLPGVPLHHIRMLVNHPIKDINPGAIILKEGETPKDVLLLISGLVEKICTRDNLYGSLRSGALIGDGVIIDNSPSLSTYRASSFVRVLKLPAGPGGLYAKVIKRNGLLEHVQKTANIRAFLETTKLFVDGLPAEVFNRIIDSVSERVYLKGDIISDKDLQIVNIICYGSVERIAGSKVLDVLKERDFFGEEGAILNVPYLYSLRVMEDMAVIQIPGKLLKNVPILSWRFLESYQQRTERFVYGNKHEDALNWHDIFSLNVAQMDIQHMHFIEIGNAIIEHLQKDIDRESLNKVFKALVDYTHYHFEDEENLMSLYQYSGIETHRKHHKELIRKVTEYIELVRNGDVPQKAAFMSFFESWVVKHLLEEDRKYGEFLNAKGIY